MMKDKNLDYDWFKTTRVFEVFTKMKRAPSERRLKDIWLKPKEYIKITSEYYLNQTNAYEMDFWSLTFGYEGSGKSSKNLMQYAYLIKKLGGDPKKEIVKDLILMQSEYAQTVYLFSKNKIFKHPILTDDAHYIFGKYYGLTSESQSLLQLARFSRDQQIINLLNTQVPQQLFADIWRERVNTYEYCFSLNVVDKNDMIVGRYMYVAFYNVENSQYLRLSKLVRLPIFWKMIITRYVPNYLTRFDVLFDEHKELYYTYKYIKSFYKQFYSLLRYLGVSKGRYFEMIFRLLSALTDVEPYTNEYKAIVEHFIRNLPELTRRKFYEYGVIRKNPDMMSQSNPEGLDIHPELLYLVREYSEIIKVRTGLNNVNVKLIKKMAKESKEEDLVMETLRKVAVETGSNWIEYDYAVDGIKGVKNVDDVLKRLHRKGQIIISEINGRRLIRID